MGKIAAECCGSCADCKTDLNGWHYCGIKEKREIVGISKTCNHYTPRNPIDNPLYQELQESIQLADKWYKFVIKHEKFEKKCEELKEFNDQLLKTNALIAKEHKATKKMWEATREFILRNYALPNKISDAMNQLEKENKDDIC